MSNTFFEQGYLDFITKLGMFKDAAGPALAGPPSAAQAAALKQQMRQQRAQGLQSTLQGAGTSAGVPPVAPQVSPQRHQSYLDLLGGPAPDYNVKFRPPGISR